MSRLGGHWEAIGSGYELAHYLLKRLWPQPAGRVERTLIIASHVLKEVKEGMKYCGGDSDIIYLLKGYHAGYVPALGIDLNERMMDRIATIVQPLAPAVTDVTVLPTQLDAILATMLAEIHAARPMEFVKKQSERFGRSGRSSGGDGQDHWSCTDDYYFWPSNG